MNVGVRNYPGEEELCSASEGVFFMLCLVIPGPVWEVVNHTKDPESAQSLAGDSLTCSYLQCGRSAVREPSPICHTTR